MGQYSPLDAAIKSCRIYNIKTSKTHSHGRFGSVDSQALHQISPYEYLSEFTVILPYRELMNVELRKWFNRKKLIAKKKYGSKIEYWCRLHT
jgi:hypothetical protein